MECTSRFNFSRLAVIVVLSLTIFSEVLLLTLKAASSSSPQGRTYSILESTYQEQVIKVEGVENLDSESFPQGLGIKIKNVSDKPVYFITLYVTVYFNQRFGDRDKTGMIFNFGSGRLISFNELANLQDPHIKPGETYVLTLDDKSLSNFRNHVSDMKIPVSAMRRLTLNFQNIRFGDGTGFSGRIFYPGNTSLDKKTAL